MKVTDVIAGKVGDNPSTTRQETFKLKFKLLPITTGAKPKRPPIQIVTNITGENIPSLPSLATNRSV